MIIKQDVALVLLLLSGGLVDVQMAQKAEADAIHRADPITHMTGGVTMSTVENVRIRADRAEHNQQTGEVALFGNVTLSQDRRPAVNIVEATNRAGAPFPEVVPVTFRIRAVELSVGNLVVTADEADVNGLTGEMTLRGNVRVRRNK